MFRRLLLVGVAATPAILAAQRVTTEASASVVSINGVRADAPMHFGEILALRGGQVRLGTDNDASYSPGILPGPGAGQAPTSALFVVRSGPGQRFFVRVNPTHFQVIPNGGIGQPMEVEVNAIRFSRIRRPQAFRQDAPGITRANGEENFLLGSTLTVNPGQAAGTYTGNYEVEVTFQ